MEDIHRAPLDTGEAYKRLWALNDALEKDPAVGKAMSLPVVQSEIDRRWYSDLLRYRRIFQRKIQQTERGRRVLESAKHGAPARQFITPDDKKALFLLRMRETVRNASREQIIHRLEAMVRREGFRTLLVGGEYSLLGDMGRLITSSIITGSLLLIGIFTVMGFVFSRSLRTGLIFFGTENMLPKAKVVQRTRLSFFREAQIWYGRDPQQCPIDDQFQNVIVLSDEFYREISSHPTPTDLEAVKAPSDSPAVLDLFMWLSYRWFVAKGEESIPLFGPFGLSAQIGSGEYARPRRFRENVEKWLDTVRLLWPKCPARINSDGQTLRISREVAASSRSSLSPGDRESWSDRP